MATNAISSYTITYRGSMNFTVENPAGRSYEVDMNRPSCTCADFMYRGERSSYPTCKHIRMVNESLEKPKWRTCIDCGSIIDRSTDEPAIICLDCLRRKSGIEPNDAVTDDIGELFHQSHGCFEY